MTNSKSTDKLAILSEQVDRIRSQYGSSVKSIEITWDKVQFDTDDYGRRYMTVPSLKVEMK